MSNPATLAHIAGLGELCEIGAGEGDVSRVSTPPYHPAVVGQPNDYTQYTEAVAKPQDASGAPMSTKPDTWMPLVIGDYLKDTTHLTTLLHGAYLLLIMSYWVDGPPPDDDETLASITKMDAKTWRKSREKLARFFTMENGAWRQKRIDAELARWIEKKQVYSERAAAGGRAKAAKSRNLAGNKHGKTVLKSCLEAAPQPAPTEVDGLTDQSTLCSREENEARQEGASFIRNGVINIAAARRALFGNEDEETADA